VDAPQEYVNTYPTPRVFTMVLRVCFGQWLALVPFLYKLVDKRSNTDLGYTQRPFCFGNGIHRTGVFTLVITVHVSETERGEAILRDLVCDSLRP